MELTELCHELRNWFEVKKTFGTFEIKDGSIDLDLQENQYFRIVGSVFNDGVHQYPAYGLADETFEGSVWAMAVPSSVIALLADINEWEDKYGNAVQSPYTSESFGGYSYSKGSSSSTSGTDTVTDYRSVFANRLYPWRKL